MKDYVPFSSNKDQRNTTAGPASNTLINLLKVGLSMVGIAVILTPLLWVPDFLSRPLGSVGVTGNRVVTAKEVVGRLELSDQETWLDLDPFVLENKGLSEPWIEAIDIKKNSDLGLSVEIHERQPVAYLKTKSGIFLVDQEFMVLGIPQRWGGWDLPVLSASRLTVSPGDRLSSAGVSRAFELMDRLKSDPVIPLGGVSEIKIDNPMNLVLVTQPGGLRVKMGFNHFEEKLHRLHIASQDLVGREGRLAYIDLRHPQGVVIRRK